MTTTLELELGGRGHFMGNNAITLEVLDTSLQFPMLALIICDNL